MFGIMFNEKLRNLKISIQSNSLSDVIKKTKFYEKLCIIINFVNFNLGKWLSFVDLLFLLIFCWFY